MKPLRVFVVEDEAIVAMMIEDILTDMGHEIVATAGRLDRAMTLAAELEIDIAILDLNLNGEQTYCVATLLASRNVGIVFSTGYGTEGVREEWRHRPLLQKPFDEKEFGRVVSRLQTSMVEDGALGG